MDCEAPSMMISERSKKMRTHYTGNIARGYDARRAGQEKWRREQEILAEIIGALPVGASALDIPCGTGRLFPFFAERWVSVIALDISDDMIEVARAKYALSGGDISIGRGDIFKIDLLDMCVGTAFAIRIMNRIGIDDVPLALAELQRVAKRQVVFNLRVDDGNSRYRHAVPMSMVHGALQPGWQIVSDQEIHEPDFRMLVFARD
jgi:ubiquinone/menaquinone biosynthesis C-methylase UbiE